MKTSISAAAGHAVRIAIAVCLVATLTTSVMGYQSSMEKADAENSRRIAVRYVATKLAQHDGEGQIAVEDMDDASVLAMYEPDGKTCRLYWHNGALRESYCWSDESFDPESGTPIMETGPIGFVYNGILSMISDGGTSYFQMKSGGATNG